MAEIKISELSVGDWVQDILGNICIVRNIFCGDLVECYVVGKGDELGIMIDRLRPVPLTPEILEKNGFRLVVVNKKFNDWYDNNITIRKYYNEDNYNLFGCGQKIKFKMLSVHQLQHALRLAGAEKEIDV
jgi:hypothetical protein